MPVVYKPPFRILKELGITEPHEIDVEAIAQYCGATIVYDRLSGCEARILGNDSRAMMIGEWSAINAERGANDYAAELLMPPDMFKRAAHDKPITFDTVRELANMFQTSLTAAAIRLVRLGSFPAMLVYLEDGKRKWFISGEDVPKELWPLEAPRLATTAADLLQGRPEDKPTPIQADGWIDHPRSNWYEVVEHSIMISPTTILSLLWWKNEKQLLDLDSEEG